MHVKEVYYIETMLYTLGTTNEIPVNCITSFSMLYILCPTDVCQGKCIPSKTMLYTLGNTNEIPVNCITSFSMLYILGPTGARQGKCITSKTMLYTLGISHRYLQ